MLHSSCLTACHWTTVTAAGYWERVPAAREYEKYQCFPRAAIFPLGKKVLDFETLDAVL